MALIEISNGISGDFLFYGNGVMHRQRYESEAVLYYEIAPDIVEDPNGDDGRGSITVKPKAGSDGNPMGNGSADPEHARDAGIALGKLYTDLDSFHQNTMKKNLATLDKSWKGPAHDAVHSILTGF